MESDDEAMIKRINSSIVLATNIDNATDDTYKYKLNDIKVTNFNKLIKHNTSRKKETRRKYDCILESDLPHLTKLFNRIRSYFYGIPIVSDQILMKGGLYVNCLPPRAHKTYKFYLFNFRCERDKEYVGDIEKLLESYGFSVFCD